MKINRHIIIKGALFLSAFFLSCTFLHAQDLLQLLPGSKKLEYSEKLNAHKLVGGASFIYQNNTMYCDSAYFYDKKKVMKAYGNVHVLKENSLNLYCDSLHYRPSTRIADMYGNVRVIDADYKLTTDSMEFNTKTQVGIYRHGGKIKHLLKNEVLTSTIGYLFTASKNFTFSKNVRYKSDSISMTTDTLDYKYQEGNCYFFGPTDISTTEAQFYCERGWFNVNTNKSSLQQNAKIEKESAIILGDTLNYFPSRGYSEGMGNVFFEDTTDQLFFRGEYALFHDSLNYSLLTKKAIASKILDDDTVHIHADTLFNLNDSLDNRIHTKGYHGVKIFSKKMQGVADSLSFVDSNERIDLFYNPIVWAKNGEVKGEFMQLFVNDSVIRKIEVDKHASIVMEVDSGLYYNQIGGKHIVANFRDNELKQAIATGNAQTVFFPTSEEKTDTAFVVKRIGMNRLYASSLKVYLDSGEVKNITYYDKPDGKFYPMDKIDEKEQFIQSFDWKEALRPKKLEDLFEE